MWLHIFVCMGGSVREYLLETKQLLCAGVRSGAVNNNNVELSVNKFYILGNSCLGNQPNGFCAPCIGA